jgi:hypothetical protein
MKTTFTVEHATACSSVKIISIVRMMVEPQQMLSYARLGKGKLGGIE